MYATAPGCLFAVNTNLTDYIDPWVRLATPVSNAKAPAAPREQQHGWEIQLVRNQEASKAVLQHPRESKLPAMLHEIRSIRPYFAARKRSPPVVVSG